MHRFALLTTAVLFFSTSAISAGAGEKTEPKVERPSKMAAALHEAIEHPDRYPDLRIGIDGFLDDGVRSLTVYGRGLGAWNNELQIELSKKQVRKCLKLLEKYEFLSMPERIGSEEPADPRGRVPAEGTQLIRSVTLVIAGMSQTVEQDNKAPESAPFREMVAEIVNVCRPSSSTGIASSDLADGLKKIADGALAPELLKISCNAPQLRSLTDQKGQGWILHLSHGVLTVTPQSLAHGVGVPAGRTLTPPEIRNLARLLVTEEAASWPANLNLPGYLQLSIRVLNRHTDVMARQFAGKPEPAAPIRASFSRVRGTLFNLSQEITTLSGNVAE